MPLPFSFPANPNPNNPVLTAKYNETKAKVDSFMAKHEAGMQAQAAKLLAARQALSATKAEALTARKTQVSGAVRATPTSTDAITAYKTKVDTLRERFAPPVTTQPVQSGASRGVSGRSTQVKP